MALLDLEDPRKVIARGKEYIMAPREMYERVGDVPNTLFPTGLVHDPATDQLRVYYGAADTVIAVASAPLETVLEYVMSCPEPHDSPQ